MMQLTRLGLTACAALAVVVVGSSGCSSSPSAAPPNWQLAWSDEFTEASLDTTKWVVDTGSSFGTNQEDYDTGRPNNLDVTGGNLVITAQEESYMGASVTSGRIETNGMFSQAYGRFEARIQLPKGQGMWPAFWLLGDDYASAGWPACGEIDIMEMRGATPSTVLGSIHGPGGDSYTEGFNLTGGATFADDFHIFALEWEPGQLRWYVDSQLFETQSSDLLPASQPWVFDHPFFIILDLAVGGTFGGASNSSTTFPQTMTVDYVRVYTNGPSNGDGGAAP